MRRTRRPARRRAHPIGLLLVVAAFLLPACEVLFRPQLAVDPHVLEFPAQTSSRAIRVSNVGVDGSLLRWEASGSPRLTASPSSGTLRAGESADVWLSVNRAGLDETSLLTAQVAGAGQTVEVRAIVDPAAPITPAGCDPDPSVRYAGIEPWPLEAAAAAFAAAGIAPSGVSVRWHAPTGDPVILDARSALERIPAAAAALVSRVVSHDGGAWLASSEPLALARSLRATPSVRWVELDGPIVRPTAAPRAAGPAGAAAAAQPNDPRYLSGDQWYLDAFGFASGRLAPAAVRADDVVVAVIDTGLRTTHEEHAGRIVGGRSFLRGGTSDVVADGDGHGTHVAGLVAAAEGNGVGIVGLAAHASVRVQPIKVFGDGGQATIADLATAVRWAAGLAVASAPTNTTRVDVVNMSLGSAFPSAELRLAVIDARCAGVLLVAAAGNGGVDGGVDYPAAYPEVVSVGSVDGDMRRSSFSDYGEGLVDLMAPGGRPPSPAGSCNGLWSTFSTADDAYACLQGTSMATPLVAASAAALIASDPALFRGDPAALESALRAAAERRPGPSSAEYGFGILCLDALLGASSVCGAPH
jgi:subtilisin family serine protease